jgi:pseudouridine synthase
MPLKEAEAAIRAARVTVNGRAVLQPHTLLRAGDAVRLDRRSLRLDARTQVLAFHKPAGCVTSHQDASGHPTVFDRLLPALPTELRSFGWHAVGRLDVDTTGLLLFTNDEHFVAHATSPELKLPKTYRAQVQGTPDDQRLAPLRRGIPLGSKKTAPAGARVLSPTEVELVLTEGGFHQVKRMLGAVGLPVRALHRSAVGGVTLDVQVGAVRPLTDAEVRTGLRYEPRTFHPV